MFNLQRGALVKTSEEADEMQVCWGNCAIFRSNMELADVKMDAYGRSEFWGLL